MLHRGSLEQWAVDQALRKLGQERTVQLVREPEQLPMSSNVPTNIVELIDIANGGTYTPPEYRRSLFSEKLVREERWEFGLDKQLAAIEALGQTNNEDALIFLSKLAKYEVEYGSPDPDNSRNYYSNPYANGDLKKELCYVEDVNYNTRNKPQYNEKVHDSLERAIEGLRTSFGIS